MGWGLQWSTQWEVPAHPRILSTQFGLERKGAPAQSAFFPSAQPPETCPARPKSWLPGWGEGLREQEGPPPPGVQRAVSVSIFQGRDEECAAPGAARVPARPAWRSGADPLPPKTWTSLLSK